MTPRLLAAATTLALGLCTSAAFAGPPQLVASLAAPAELRVGESDVYTLKASNTGSSQARNVTTSMALLPGMVVLQMPSICRVNPQMTQLQCGLDVVPARRSRSYQVKIQAPGQPAVGMHSAVVTASNAAPAVSPTVITNYSQYSVVVVPGSVWEMRSCSNGSSGPVPYDQCPTGSEYVSTVTLGAGGALIWEQQVLPDYRWEQPSPSVVVLNQYDSSGALYHVTHYSAISTKCLRGPGSTVQPGAATEYTASKICLR